MIKHISLFVILILGLTTGCQSAEKRNFDSIINNNTKSNKVYSGFHQTFEAHLTAHNREVTEAILKQTAAYRGWDEQTLQLETQKANDKRLTSSLFFLRFYSPDQDYDDLHKPDSIWKIYLILGNQKFPGKMTKDFGKLVEIQTLYSHFDRFSTGYEVTFPIGRPSLEGQSYKVLLTSSLGQAEFQF